MRTLEPVPVLLIALTLGVSGVAVAESEAGGAGWKSWHAGNEVENLASLQRGARNFMGYCSGCHSLKYERYSRMAQDL